MKNPVKNKYYAVEGMDGAVIGYALRDEQVVLIYDFTKMVKTVIAKSKLTLNEAIETVEEKIEGAWIGLETPIIMHTATYDEIKEIFNDKAEGTIN